MTAIVYVINDVPVMAARVNKQQLTVDVDVWAVWLSPREKWKASCGNGQTIGAVSISMKRLISHVPTG